MIWLCRLSFALTAMLAIAGNAPAAEFSERQRGEIESIVRDYLLKHPELLQEVFGALEKKQTAAQADSQRQAVAANAEALFNSTRQAVIGNPRGRITLVEFFDYNCGYCKRALADMQTLLKSDPDLRIVLKEFPVLGPGSLEAAQVSVAVLKQGNDKYLAFHTRLLSDRGPADKSKALAAAKATGLDMAKLEKDLAAPEIESTLEESYRLANALGLTGTPSYVVGEQVVIGAVGAEALKERIETTRANGGPTR
jgi:protein-disulfide isomerase